MKDNVPPKLIFRPKKKLGQNFLFDKNYLQKIVGCCPVDVNTVIIEIGSGYGNLTNFLAKTNCQKVIGLEKDRDLFQQLKENDKIIYFHKDALKINWPEFCSQYKDNNNSLIIVGNLPYYITNSLIVNLLFEYYLFDYLVFLVQKEVGEKWVASPSNNYSSSYSALSVFINCLAKTRIAFKAPSQVFFPSPSVDGVLVIIEPFRNANMSKEYSISFLHFLKDCFRFRRKTLLNNLLGFAGNHKKEWERYLAEKGYPAKIRPQNLSPEEYWKLFLFWQKIC